MSSNNLNIEFTKIYKRLIGYFSHSELHIIGTIDNSEELI